MAIVDCIEVRLEKMKAMWVNSGDWSVNTQERSNSGQATLGSKWARWALCEDHRMEMWHRMAKCLVGMYLHHGMATEACMATWVNRHSVN